MLDYGRGTLVEMSVAAERDDRAGVCRSAALVMLLVVSACSGGFTSVTTAEVGTSLQTTTIESTRPEPAVITLGPPPSQVQLIPSTASGESVPASTPTAPALTPVPIDEPLVCKSGDDWFETAGGRRFRAIASSGSTLRPIVVVLHGFTGSTGAIERTSGWTRMLDEIDVVLVYPEGTAVPERAGYGWAAGTQQFSVAGADDVAFLLDVIETVAASHCGDLSSVTVTGESNGGAMALRLACDQRSAGRLWLVSPVIPAVDEGTIGDCASSTPVRLFAVASENDGLVPFEPDERRTAAPLGQVSWFRSVAVALNRCATGPVVENGEGRRWWSPSDCLASTMLVSVTDGDGHTWPGGPAGTGGMDPGGYPTTQAIVSLIRSEHDAPHELVGGWLDTTAR